MKKILRTIQTLFPFLQDKVYWLTFNLMKFTKTPHEKDFNMVQFFNPKSKGDFVDIGSNRGQAITSMLLMSTSNRRIIGFEPNPLVFNKLERNFSNNESVLVHNLGLANENKEFNLYVPFYRKWMFDGLSSFNYKSARNWLRNRLWFYDDKKLNVKKVKCKIRRLDEFSLEPYFMKIDVEGYEMEVIKGGINTIKKHKPILLIEAITDDIMNLLDDVGYQFYHYDNDKLIEGKGEVNTFCICQEKYEKLAC